MMRTMEDDPKIEWTDPDSVTTTTRDAEELGPAVADQLARYGARPWQIELTAPILVAAILAAEQAD